VDVLSTRKFPYIIAIHDADIAEIQLLFLYGTPPKHGGNCQKLNEFLPS